MIKLADYCPKKVISGGQTGADQGALEAANRLGIATGGWAPPGFWTSKGKQPNLSQKYGLEEIEGDATLYPPPRYWFVQRSKMNVDASDCTIAFRDSPSPGTDCTIGYCLAKKWKSTSQHALNPYDLTGYKPVLLISDFRDYSKTKENISKIAKFLELTRPKVLNVCGHRDPSLKSVVKHFLIEAFIDDVVEK